MILPFVTTDCFRARYKTPTGSMGSSPGVFVIPRVSTESGCSLDEWKCKLGTYYWHPFSAMETEVEGFDFEKKGRIKPMSGEKQGDERGRDQNTGFQAISAVQPPWFPLDTLVSPQ